MGLGGGGKSGGHKASLGLLGASPITSTEHGLEQIPRLAHVHWVGNGALLLIEVLQGNMAEGVATGKRENQV